MRTFILYARKARTDSNFNIEDLPSSGGRMDLVCRCITSALWLSHRIRDDTRIFVILNGPPNPPVTICFDGFELSRVSTDERSTAIWIKKALSLKFDKEWKKLWNGIKISRKSFQEIIKEIKNSEVYILHERGKSIKNVKFADNVTIIVGDHIGLPSKEEKFALRYGKKISLGKGVYLASSCISVINWILDNKYI